MPDLDFAPVIWRLGLDVADQPTSDDPDDYPDTIWFDGGRILLTPYTGVVKVVGGNPVPFTAVSSTYEAEIDAEGYMLYRGKRVMWVTDLTSDKVNPKIGDDLATHRVTVTGATAGGVPVTLEPFDVRITAAGDGVSVVVVDGTEYPANDITRLAPVIPGAAQPIFRGERGVSVAAASIDATTGDLVFTLDDPLATELNAGPIPVTEAATTAATDAADAAALATTKADEASTSAGTATTSATAAATAKTDAEAARDTLLGQKGAASGIAPLDGSSKVPAANLPGSTTSAQGVVELATTAETTTGTDTSRAVTPAGVKAAVDPIRDITDPTFQNNLAASFAQRWKASTAVLADDIRIAPTGETIKRVADGTTRVSYDATEQTAWTVVGGGGGAVSLTDNGDGTATLTGVSATDNNDGTATIAA